MPSGPSSGVYSLTSGEGPGLPGGPGGALGRGGVKYDWKNCKKNSIKNSQEIMEKEIGERNETTGEN